MLHTDLAPLTQKYSHNAVCLCLLADLKILLRQEELQKEALTNLQTHVKSLTNLLTT